MSWPSLLAAGCASSGLRLDAIIEALDGGLHPLRLCKHRFGDLLQLMRSFVEELRAFGERELIVHRVGDCADNLDRPRPFSPRPTCRSAGRAAPGSRGGEPNEDEQTGHEAHGEKWGRGARGALTPGGDPRQ
jgi:hypothetical protein